VKSFNDAKIPFDTALARYPELFGAWLDRFLSHFPPLNISRFRIEDDIDLIHLPVVGPVLFSVTFSPKVG
jgi:hypothetical protein